MSHDSTPSRDAITPLVEAYQEAEREVELKRPAHAAHNRELLEKMLAARRRRTHAELVSRRPYIMAGGLALAMLCLVSGVSLWSSTLTLDSPRSPDATVALRSDDPGCQLVRIAAQLQLTRDCTWSWTDHFTQLTSLTAATVDEPTPEGVRIARGEVRVQVDPRRPRAFPVRILVSGGVIEVVGTEFTVREYTTHGHVELHEGSIRFLPGEGAAVMIAPGETFHWGEPSTEVEHVEVPRGEEPVEDEEQITPSSRRPATPTARVTQAEREALTASEMLSVRKQRRLGQHDAAIQALDAMSRRTTSATTLEVISYEKGDMLSGLGDPRRACEHWSRHLTMFARGRYAAQVKARYEALECSPP